MLPDKDKKKEQLIDELAGLRQRVAELKTLETEHKRMEEKLQASTRQWQTTFDAISNAVCLLDIEGRILQCNTAMTNLLGKPFSEINGRTCWELVHGTSEPIEGCPVVRMRETRRKETLVLPVGDRWLEVSTDPLMDDNGNLIGAVHIMSDITEHKQVEEALRESENRFSNIAEKALEWIWEVNINGEYTYASPVCEKILGYKPEELLGKHFYDLFLPEKREQLKKAALNTFAKKQPFREFINENMHKNGERVWLSTSGVPILDERGNLLGYRGADTDITERKQAEEALRESEEKYKSLVKNVKLGVFRSTPEPAGRFLEINPAMEEITGYCRKELLQMNVVDLHVNPEERRLVLEEIALGKGKAAKEVHLRRKDGTEIVVSDTKVAVRDDTGNILYFDGIMDDITERKRAEETLRESRDYLERLTNSMWDAVFSVKMPERVIEWANDSFRLIGYEPEECVGRTTEFLYPDKSEFLDFGNKLKKAVASGEDILHTEQLLKRKNGEIFPAEVTVTIIRNEKGEVITVTSIIRDITERRQAEEALKESEEKYRTLAESSLTGIFIYQDGKYVFINDRFARMHDYTIQELLGKNYLILIHPDDREAIREIAAKRLEGQAVPQQYEVRRLKKDGETIWCEAIVTRIEYRGKPANMGSIIDITERKQAEEREKNLQQELNLASRLAAIGELAAGVAHELNNPLCGIMGFSERLLRKSTDETSKRYLQRIHDEASRAAKVVENLRTFARRREPKKEYSDINDIMQKALELRAYELKTSNIQVILDLSPTLPKTMVDFYQMQEVFLNLILNAEQVTSEANRGGNLSIKTQPMKDYIRVSFADEGPGIPADQRDKVFDPFFTTRGEKGGTGLGLSICHGIVAQHNGKIYVKSRVGKGATFFVELPVITEEIDEGK